MTQLVTNNAEYNLESTKSCVNIINKKALPFKSQIRIVSVSTISRIKNQKVVQGNYDAHGIK